MNYGLPFLTSGRALKLRWDFTNDRSGVVQANKCRIDFVLDIALPSPTNEFDMDLRFSLQILAGCALVTALFSCGGGGQQNPPPNLAPLPPQGAAAGLDPAGGPPGGPPAERTIQQGEFSLTLVADDDIKGLVSIPAHVISTDSDTAAQLAGEGKGPKYWQSPARGAHVRQMVFGQQGTSQTTLAVPSIPAKDAIVLAVDLAAPVGGNDFRIIKIPLELDYTDPTKPLARPIRVRLTRNGWQREN